MKHETNFTPRADTMCQAKSSNPYPNAYVVRCSLFGTDMCPNHACDGYTRNCTAWKNHSGK